jgi:hypothetical protein
MSGILVVAEARKGVLKKSSLEAVAAARELADKAGRARGRRAAGCGPRRRRGELAKRPRDQGRPPRSDALANYSRRRLRDRPAADPLQI